MKIIINTTNLYGGGGIQVAYSFINECRQILENEYYVFLCKPLSSQIVIDAFPDNFRFFIFENAPSILLKGRRMVKKLKELENSINPDCVFSVFGPTYWSPKSPHLMGYAIPHFLYLESPFYNMITFKEKIKWRVLYYVKREFLLKNSKYFHVETEDARNRLSKYLGVSITSIYTVSNTYNSTFDIALQTQENILPQKKPFEFRFVCISTYYNHKNIEILNKVIPLLKESGFINVKFVITIKQDVFEKIFSETSKTQIINIGPINIDSCQQLYNECDAMFLPTLLECFSANYPEAMKMRKPIVTSNMSFAKNICGNAAHYFNPSDPEDIASKIIHIANDEKLRKTLIQNGLIRLKEFNSANEKAKKYLDICKEIVKKESNR